MNFNFIDFGARLFNPALAVWTTADPMAQYHSPYVYCGDDPMNRVDPTGMWDRERNPGFSKRTWSLIVAAMDGGTGGNESAGSFYTVTDGKLSERIDYSYTGFGTTFGYSYITGSYYYDGNGEPMTDKENMSASFWHDWGTIELPAYLLIGNNSSLTDNEKIGVLTNQIHEGQEKFLAAAWENPGVQALLAIMGAVDLYTAVRGLAWSADLMTLRTAKYVEYEIKSATGMTEAAKGAYQAYKSLGKACSSSALDDAYTLWHLGRSTIGEIELIKGIITNSVPPLVSQPPTNPYNYLPVGTSVAKTLRISPVKLWTPPKFEF